MTPPLYIAGKKKGDKLILPMSPYIRAQLAKRPDGPIEAEVHWREPTRRARANRWLMGPVYSMMLEEQEGRVTEGAKLELHDAMKLRHNPKQITDPFTGEVHVVGGDTHTMSIGEFSNFIEAVMKDGSEYLGIEWPEPSQECEWRR